MRERKDGFAPPAVGGSSLLVIFAVLCLTVFALLSLATVQADTRLADASVKAVEDYYAADCAAQELLARLRAGERPGEVRMTRDGGRLYADYALPISEAQELRVSVLLEGPGSLGYQILRWQAVPVGEWAPDGELELWDGLPF